MALNLVPIEDIPDILKSRKTERKRRSTANINNQFVYNNDWELRTVSFAPTLYPEIEITRTITYSCLRGLPTTFTTKFERPATFLSIWHEYHWIMAEAFLKLIRAVVLVRCLRVCTSFIFCVKLPNVGKNTLKIQDGRQQVANKSAKC